jgi:3-oxoacyl-[acyl-carrier protein] reductase
VCANELGPLDITVNSTLVGPTDTEVFDGLLEKVPEFESMLVQRWPLGRIGRPADMADVVAFLVSDDARWVTGQGVRVDGGAALTSLDARSERTV